jgi:hypothetical protein
LAARRNVIELRDAAPMQSDGAGWVLAVAFCAQHSFLVAIPGNFAPERRLDGLAWLDHVFLIIIHRKIQSGSVHTNSREY